MSRTSLHRDLQLLGDLGRLRLAAQPLDQLALHVGDPVQLLDHVDRDPDRPRLVGDRPRDRLPDPPGRVRRELVAAPVVELLDRPDQAQRPLLDQIQEPEPAPEVTLRDRHHQAQVRLDHVPLRIHVAALDPLGQLDLLLGRQQLHPADRAQVEAQRVQARLDGEVELGLLRRPIPLRLLVGGQPVLADDVDPLLDQVRVQALHLLLGDLHLLERGGDLLERQVALLLALGNERLQLLGVRRTRPRCRPAGVSPSSSPCCCSLPSVSRTSPFSATCPPSSIRPAERREVYESMPDPRCTSSQSPRCIRAFRTSELCRSSRSAPFPGPGPARRPGTLRRP